MRGWLTGQPHGVYRSGINGFSKPAGVAGILANGRDGMGVIARQGVGGVNSLQDSTIVDRALALRAPPRNFSSFSQVSALTCERFALVRTPQ